jgi:hypothetical protein
MRHPLTRASRPGLPLTLRFMLFGAVSMMAAACAHSSGTAPHEMSSVEHEEAAREEERTAEAHQDQFDPEATGIERRCTPGKGVVCWTSTVNPTAEHAAAAERHRELARKHRAASQALVDTEDRTCAGIEDEDRATSPFAHFEDIKSVSPLREETKTGKATRTKTAGAEIVFRAIPGMTAEWLQRLVDCHIARSATIGHETASSDMPACPLTLKGIQANVRSVGDGFAVTVRSDDTATANEILRRAELIRIDDQGAE